MYGLLLADVAREVYRDWERRFYKRVNRRSTEIGMIIGPSLHRAWSTN
jgi:hypothetical protein